MTLRVAGSAQRSFTFPADLPTTRAYFSQFNHILHFLPHIALVKAYSATQFRLVYQTVELGVYQVKIYCDLEGSFDEARQALHFRSTHYQPPIKPDVTINSLSAQGTFTSQSDFHASHDQTRIDYAIQLQANLPKPIGLSLIPDRVVEQIARNITVWRIREIADGFIERSIKEYKKEVRKNHF